jgi:NADH-quinone oxidoreductase subunit J
VQVIVYAGAIVVLFLFVIMLLGIDRAESIAADPLKGQRVVALALGVLVLAEVVLLARGRWPTGAHSTAGGLNQAGKPNVNVLGTSIFTTFLLPFEITSALLVIAIVGAVVLARRPRRDAAPAVTIDDTDDPDPDDSDDSAADDDDDYDYVDYGDEDEDADEDEYDDEDERVGAAGGLESDRPSVTAGTRDERNQP